MSFFKRLLSTLTKSEQKALIISIAIGGVALIVAIVAFMAIGTKAVPVSGGEFTEGMVGQPEYLNPVIARSETDLSLVKLVYANVPEIADAIQPSADGKTWVVRLKPDLHWQDGTQLTSDDVIFTVQSIQSSDAASPLAAEWQGVTVSRASELEVDFTLAAPYAFFADDLANLYILPKHIFGAIPPGNWKFSQYNLKPVGSGPYQFSSYDQRADGFITDYHLAAWDQFPGQQALIQNFNLAFFDNQSDVIDSFNAAQIDGFAATPSDLTTVKRPAQISAWPTTSDYAVFWNQGNNAALADPAVRAALTEAVDRGAVTSQAFGNYAATTYGPIPPAAQYATQVTATTSLDLASTTLTNAGWQMNAFGIWQKTISHATTTLSFTLTVPDDPSLVAAAQVLQNDWQVIGVQVTIATDTPANVAADATNRSYDALLYGQTLGPSSDLYAFWNSNARFAPGENLALYSNPNDDALMTAIRMNMSDASRTTMFAELQNDIVSANPALFLFSPDDIYVSGKTIGGITTSTPLVDPSDRFSQVPAWYLNTTRVLK